MDLIPEAGMPQFGRPAGPAIAQLADHLEKAFPRLGGARRSRQAGKRAERVRRSRDVVKHALGRARPDARHQLHDPEPRNAVTRVFNKAEHRQQILDVSGFEKLSPPNLTKGMLPRLSSISSRSL